MVFREASHAYNAAHKAVATTLFALLLWKDSTYWQQWEAFYTWMFIPGNLAGVKQPVKFLQIFQNEYRKDSLPPMDTPFKNEVWSNTFYTWVKYLRQWVPLTPDSTFWEASMVIWDNIVRPM